MKWLLLIMLSSCATTGFVEGRERLCRQDICPDLAKTRHGLNSSGHYDVNSGDCLCVYHNVNVAKEKVVAVPVDAPLEATDDGQFR